MQQGTPEYDHMAQERAFVERLQQKDAGAWKTLVVDYHPFLEQVIRRSLSKRNLPLEYKDDIEAKAWFTAFGKIKSFSPRE
ncbi:MAG: hypothetical protein K8I30_15515, partial [Anaerolineae bacterium]|nr:hypothetical protein [Anaerolineae bacterium]